MPVGLYTDHWEVGTCLEKISLWEQQGEDMDSPGLMGRCSVGLSWAGTGGQQGPRVTYQGSQGNPPGSQGSAPRKRTVYYYYYFLKRTV